MAEAVAAPSNKFWIYAGMGAGIALLITFIGMALRSFAVDVSVYSNAAVKNGLFTIWGLFAGLLLLAVIGVAAFFKYKGD